MAIPAVPLRTPMYDAQGNLSRVWILFFQSLGTTTASGGDSTSSYDVPIAGAIATPDASQGVNVLVLTADTTLGPPISYSGTAGIETPWALVVQQDAVGGHSLIFDPSYYLSISLATAQSPALTQCHAYFKTQASGNTYIAGAPSIDQPIAP